MPGHLHAPWRMDYLRAIETPPQEREACFLCAASAAASDDDRRRRLVLWATEHALVLLNRYPYASGHVLIAPRRHVADPAELDDAETLDLERQSQRACAVLRRALNPHGFNLGVNLGRAAGAGLPDHLHRHAVPRWSGDTNFATVVGDVRVVPQAWDELWQELMRASATLSS